MNYLYGIVLGVLLMLGQVMQQPIVDTASGGLNPCLVSAWAMNEGSGSTFNSFPGTPSNTATIGGGAVTWTANAIKSGVTSPVWTGSGGGAEATSTTLTNFSNTQAFSVSIWVNFADNNEISFMNTLNATGGTYQGWELEKQPSTSSQANDLTAFLFNNYGSANYIQVSINTTISNSTLHYLVMTYSGSGTAAGVKLYVDGVQGTNIVVQDSLSATIASGIPVWFAVRNDGTDPYNAASGYAEAYNCAITAGQISTYYAQGPGIY
jgi:hypothetical protein